MLNVKSLSSIFNIQRIASKPLELIYLSILFFISFAVPIYIAYEASGYFTDPQDQETKKNVDPVFPDSIPISTQGSHIRLKHDPLLNPTKGKDFAFLIWFKVRQLPSDQDRMVLISKQDFSNSLQPGYSLSLTRYGNSIRPLVYWKDMEGKGGWYRFSDIELAAKAWYMFFLTFREGSLLGLHIAKAIPGKKPERLLLGGFQFSTPVLPDTETDLIIGSPRNGSFRGKLGPIGIFSGIYLKKHFQEIFRDFSREPLTLPSNIKEDQVVFWSPHGDTDLGPHAHKILRVDSERHSS